MRARPSLLVVLINLQALWLARKLAVICSDVHVNGTGHYFQLESVNNNIFDILLVTLVISHSQSHFFLILATWIIRLASRN